MLISIGNVERTVQPSAAGERLRVAPANMRSLERGEALFHSGDARSVLYRVERGALCHYLRWDDGRHEVIEFAFPGDIIGFGHLGVHASTAQAVTKTMVSIVSEEEFQQLLESDGQLAARFAAATDREFDYMRVRAIESTRHDPSKRLAAFLAATARINEGEGRDPSVVVDDISSGEIAEHLNLSIEMLGGALRALQQQGLIAPSTEGLRIADIEALEKLADAA